MGLAVQKTTKKNKGTHILESLGHHLKGDGARHSFTSVASKAKQNQTKSHINDRKNKGKSCESNKPRKPQRQENPKGKKI